MALVPPPQPLHEQQALRLLFSDVSLPNQLPVFVPNPDGGATLSNAALQRQVVIGPAIRQAQLNVEFSLRRSADEIVSILAHAHARFPVEHYLALSITVVSHLPVTGETASELIERSLFKNAAPLNSLGPGRIASGIRVILAGAGQTFVTLEPLIGDPNLLYLQLTENSNATLYLQALAARIESVLRYNDNQVRQFVAEVLQ